MGIPESGGEARLAELLGGLSLATDLVAGLALETAMKTAVLSARLGAALGLPVEQRRAAYFSGVLRFLGCSSFAPEMAQVAGGDDLGLIGALTPIDVKSPAKVLARAARSHGLRAAARLALDPSGPDKLAAAHCELATELALMLEMNAAVTRAVGETYERFDGSGAPRRRRGSEISLVARIVHVAFRAEVHRGLEGPRAALRVLEQRRGSELDPEVVQGLLDLGPDALADLAAPSIWETFLDEEPGTPLRMRAERIREVARAFAHAVDAKSAFTAGHSIGVAALIEGAAGSLRLRPDEAETAITAALLHDLGRLAVPNGIWDKPGPLGPVERARMESHAQHTESILSFSPLTREFAAVASMDHERVDGSGYPRHLASPPKLGRLLAAADAYHAMTEPRPHRAAHAKEAAAKLLVDEARQGRFDRACVEAVLEAAGQKKLARVRGGRPAQLSERETEVLAQLARGCSNKEIGRELFISVKTVQHHITHLYEKTGISTRAAAAVFAVENGLL